MRIVLSILLFFLASSAAAQAPQKDNGDMRIDLETADGRLRLRGVRTLNENGEVETKVIVPPDLLRDTRLMDTLREQGVIPVPDPQFVCGVDYSDIEAEEKESDARRRAMRDKVIPLKDQYEQELYYKERRAKRYAETCAGKDKSLDGEAKPLDRVFRTEIPQKVDMTRKACEVIGEVCKPMKHW